jgi:hypothetical protein
MLVEPIQPPVLGPAEPTFTGAVAVERARTARAWLDHGLQAARRPGAVDATHVIAEALANATDAIRETIEACGELHPVRDDLHLALDEATNGLAQLKAQGPEGRTVAMRTANLAGGLLDRAIAALVEHADTTPEPDAPIA